MATLGLDTSEYEQGIEQARKETQSAANSLNRSANTAGSGVSGMANQFAAASAKATVLANMLTSLGTKAVGLAKGFVEMGISYNAQIEKYTTGFTNMLGSAQAAQEAMQAIQEDAARTPFDVASLTQANQLLISAGENAAYSRKVINALGDAVSATGGGNAELSRMAQNLQQIANVGKAASIDIKQFAYAGINIYQVLADYTGKSVQEVQNMTISYDLLSQALIAASEEGGRYYNAMDTQSQTMNGRISTLKDNVSQLAGLMTGDLSSGIGVVIGHLNDMVVAAQEAYKEDGWKGLGNAILELDNPISAIIKKFGQLGSAAVSALDKASYYLNKALGKNAYAGYDSYEDYKSDQQKQSNRNRLRQNALSGKSVSNKSWSERQAEAAAASGGSSIVTSPSSSSGKSAGTKSKTETVIASVSHTATTTAQNALGAVTTSVETLQEKVKDAAGNIKDRVTETTTETGKEMVNGVATTYTLVTKKVTDANGKISTTTKKVYADMSKTLTGTLTKVAETTFDGITTKIQEATEKYADGSEHIKKTVTETGQRIGKNGAETYEKIITYIDGIEDKVNETSTAIDNSVKGIQSRIDQYLSDASGESNKGIFGLLKSTISDAKNKDWSSLALDVTKLIWGEVSQGQRETISKWFDNALAAVNESYYGGGLKSAFTAVESLFKGGIVPGVNNATTAVDSFSKVVSGLASSGGVGGALGSVVQGFSGMAGGITSALGTVVSFISANPVLGVILGVGAVGAVAGGIGLALWAKNKKSKDPVNNYKSPFDDVGVYDSLSEFSTRSAMQYRVIGQSSHADKQTSILERIEELLDEHLPAIGTGQVVMDSGELVGVISPRMAQNVDARIGVTVTRKARGV
jgi:tape measure domain-containing protein